MTLFKKSPINPTVAVFHKFRKEGGWVIQKRLVPTEWLKKLEDSDGNKVETGHLNPLKLEDYYYRSRGVGRVPFMDMLSKLPIVYTDIHR